MCPKDRLFTLTPGTDSALACRVVPMAKSMLHGFPLRRERRRCYELFGPCLKALDQALRQVRFRDASAIVVGPRVACLDRGQRPHERKAIVRSMGLAYIAVAARQPTVRVDADVVLPELARLAHKAGHRIAGKRLGLRQVHRDRLVNQLLDIG